MIIEKDGNYEQQDFSGVSLIGERLSGVDFRNIILTNVTLDVMQAVAVARSYGANIE